MAVDSRIIFKIIPISLRTPAKTVSTYAIIDSASSVSLINTQYAKDLRLEGKNKPLVVEWTDKTMRTIEDSVTYSIQIAGLDDEDQMLTVPSMNIDLPTQSISSKDLSYIGAPENTVIPYQDATTKILIGLDYATLTASQICPKSAKTLS